MTQSGLTDALTLVALISFPGYMLYWTAYHFRRGRRSRLWLALPAIVAWCLATWYCFIALALGCLGGGCAYRDFLNYAIAYVLIAAALIAVMHWWRATSSSPAPPG